MIYNVCELKNEISMHEILQLFALKKKKKNIHNPTRFYFEYL